MYNTVGEMPDNMKTFLATKEQLSNGISNQEKLCTLLFQRSLKQDICFRRSPV